MLRLVTRNVPSPFENATGSVFHDTPFAEPLVSATSPRPSPLKSPATGSAPGWVAQVPKSAVLRLVTRNGPSPFENAPGRVFQATPFDEPPVSAMSVRPSPSKSPVIGLAPG